MGVLFTYDTLRSDTVLLNTADIRTEKGRVLSNFEDWEKFNGYYIAIGGETFLNLGMFGNQKETIFNINGVNNSNVTSFVYFFDDISVTKCNKDSLFNVILELPANVFTPNNDGVNDVYIIKHQNIAIMDVQIINRWGNVVNQFNGLLKNWEGNNKNGDPLSDGVYYIVVTATDKFGEVHKKTKTVNLLRN